MEDSSLHCSNVLRLQLPPKPLHFEQQLQKSQPLKQLLQQHPEQPPLKELLQQHTEQQPLKQLQAVLPLHPKQTKHPMCAL